MRYPCGMTAPLHPSPGIELEDAAQVVLEGWRWGGTPICPHCGSERTSRVPSGTPMPLHCRDCRRYFSVKTNTVMHGSKLPLSVWLHATWFVQQGVTNTQLGRDLGVSQKTAWHLARRIRAAVSHGGGLLADNPNPVLKNTRILRDRVAEADERERRRLQLHEQQQVRATIAASQRAQMSAMARLAYTPEEKARVKELFSLERAAVREGKDVAPYTAERAQIDAVAQQRGPKQLNPDIVAWVREQQRVRDAKRKGSSGGGRRRNKDVRLSGML